MVVNSEKKVDWRGWILVGVIIACLVIVLSIFYGKPVNTNRAVSSAIGVSKNFQMSIAGETFSYRDSDFTPVTYTLNGHTRTCIFIRAVGSATLSDCQDVATK
jgi:hypothetical protein